MKRSTQPSGSTPGKPAGKVNRTGGQNNIKSRKNLFNFKPEKVPHPPQSPVWSVEERRALVEYIALFTPVEQDQLFKWPSFKDINFWEKCADALACTTGMPRRSDDVEGFIAHLHDQLGDVFDHKEFLEQQPKILNEFTKKIDPELQFYYWTGHRHRFTTAPLPSFNDASGQTERLDRVRLSRRSDPGVFVANRASLPQRNSLTVRASFHRAPEQLPPPPTV